MSFFTRADYVDKLVSIGGRSKGLAYVHAYKGGRFNIFHENDIPRDIFVCQKQAELIKIADSKYAVIELHALLFFSFVVALNENISPVYFFSFHVYSGA